MTTQALSIVDTLDDGYQDSGSTVDATSFYANGADRSYMSFLLTAAIGAGATINNAYVRAYRLVVNSGSGTHGTMNVAVESANPATNTRPSNSHLPDSTTLLTGASSGDVSLFDYQNQYIFGQSDPIPLSLTADIQALVNTYGALAIGNRITVLIAPTAGSFYAQFEDLAAAGGHPAQLFIDWTNASAPLGFGKITSNRKYFLPSEAALVIAALESKRRLSRRRFFQWLPGAFWRK